MSKYRDIDHIVDDATTLMVMPAVHRTGDQRKPAVGDEVFLKKSCVHDCYVELTEISEDHQRFRGRSTQGLLLRDGSAVISVGDFVEFSLNKISGIYKKR